jgi:hypothetical protein
MRKIVSGLLPFIVMSPGSLFLTTYIPVLSLRLPQCPSCKLQ